MKLKFILFSLFAAVSLRADVIYDNFGAGNTFSNSNDAFLINSN